MDEIVDMICSEIAEGMCGAASDYGWSSVVNAGQESQFGDCDDQIWSQVDGVANGEAEAIEGGDAVSEIAMVCSEILETAAMICEMIRAAAEVAEWVF